MLQKAVKFKLVVGYMLIHKEADEEHVPNWTDKEWAMIALFTRILEPTIKTIKVFSLFLISLILLFFLFLYRQVLEGDSYPTQNLILVCMYMMSSRIEDMINENLADEFKKVLAAFKYEIACIFQKLPQETLIATLLDPRYELFVKHAFSY